MFKNTVAMIAGNRDLPVLAAQKAKELGYKLVVVGIKGEVENEIKKLADEYLELKLGQLRPIIEFFKKHKATTAFLTGGISRDNIITNYEPDDLAIEVMESLTDYHTDKILRGLTLKLEEHGLKIVSVIDILPEILPAFGLLTKKAPEADLIEDLKIAWHMAKEIGRLDVGQCAVVSDKITLALEGADGTDATIIRGASLAKKPVAVAKIFKPTQDMRLDLPAIGPDTIDVLVANNVGALAIEAKHTVLIKPQETIEKADKHNLSILAWTDDFIKQN